MSDQHLSDNQLNEYLDGVLTEAEQAKVEAHLGACFECTEQFGELQALFENLSSIPDEILLIDLAPIILDSLDPKPKTSWFYSWGMAIQAAAALVVLIIAIPVISSSSWIDLIYQGQENTRFFLQSGWSQILSQWVMWTTSLHQSWSLIWENFLPPTFVTLADVAVWPLFSSAGILWLVGNGLVLRRVNQNGSIYKGV